MLTLSLPLTIGMIGLVVDVGWAYWRKEACRTAADSAAIAAAVNAKKSSTFTVQSATACPQNPSASVPLQSGCLYATQNGFTNGSNGHSVTMAGGTSALGSIQPTYWVTAKVSENISALFSRVLGQSATTVSSSATAGVFISNGACIYVMDPTAQKAFNDTGGSLTLGCGIEINSNASNALNTTGHNAITMNNGSNIVVHGQWSDSTSGGCCTFNGGGSVEQNQPSFNNPISGLTAPTPSLPCTADPNVSGPHAALNQGTYCSISISNTGNGTALTLNPGTYIITSGNFHQSGGTVNATGVTLYFTSTAGGIDVTGGTLNLSAPQDGGSMDGVAVWQANNSQAEITGGTSTINGLIYMPTAPLDYTGGPTTSQTIVCDTIDVTGGSVSGPATSKFLSGGSSLSGVYVVQ
jgi:hypothetical protein